jgi:ABC-2 type transport system permease protein
VAEAFAPAVVARPVTEPSPLVLFLKTMRARSYPRLKGATRQKAWLFTEIALPLLGTIAMIYVYRALEAPRAYLGFVVLGGAIMAFWQNVLWSMATQFYWDRGEGNLEIFCVAPGSLAAVLLGMALGGIYMTLSRAAIIIGASSLLFGVTYNLRGVLPALGIFALTLAALYCLGMLLASLFLFYGREVWHLAEALQEPVYFLSGFFFPVRTLGALVGGAASLIPLTLGLDAIRQLLLPQTPVFIPVFWETLAIVVQIALYAVLAQLALVTLEQRSRRDGRLIVRTT